MDEKQPGPDFMVFTRWLALQMRASPRGPLPVPSRVAAAAREARDEFLGTQTAAGGGASLPRLEILRLLAAADRTGDAQPPELVTARGFRVSLAYEEGAGGEGGTICVLVRSPAEFIAQVQGETAFLWSGSERFELGQFDAEGKAIGTLPAGIQISLTDLSTGRIALEEPPAPSED